MPSEAETDFSTGIYRCADIKSLKIRVCLKTVKSSSVPLSGLQEDTQDDRIEDKVFSWQQRVFSPWEIKFYGDLENCKTDVQKEYHKQVMELSDDEKNVKNNIFSFTSLDYSCGMKKEILDTGCKRRTFLSHAVNQLSLSSQTDIDLHNGDVPKVNIVDLNPSLETIKRNHLLSSKIEFMCILADVGYLVEGVANEQVLVVMKWEPSLQVLTIFPDFNNNLTESGYTLEGLSDACYQYFYWVTYAKPESEIVIQKPEKKQDYCETHKSQEISLPRRGLLNMHVFGEIKSAVNFDSKDAFINYYIELPKGWSCSSPDNLFGVTHRSKNVNGLSTFNHLFELNLSLNIATRDENCHINTELFPQLLLEVISIDSWGRVCREGYGWIRLPPTPGSHHFNIHTWHPHPARSRINLLRRFFVGATSHLADRTYFGIPKSFEGRNLSKYGFGTAAGGIVNVDVSIVVQSEDPSKFSSRIFLLERLSTTTLVQSINNALRAFSSARQRMLKASLPVSFD